MCEVFGFGIIFFPSLEGVLLYYKGNFRVWEVTPKLPCCSKRGRGAPRLCHTLLLFLLLFLVFFLIYFFQLDCFPELLPKGVLV